MSNQLFKNVGTYIKSFARTAYWVIWGLHIVLGIVFLLLGFFEAADSGKDIFGLLGILISGAIIGFGYILTRLSGMLLYAYGEMAERLISIDKKLSEITPQPADKKLSETTSRPADKKLSETTSRPAPNRSVPTPPSNKPTRTTPWKCQNCEHTNPASARWCESCGTFDIGI
ncbi:MAG: hypothetical protein IJ351_01160 [Oscillospiraceae bacterium]|nr:hypothetical protein [Oscillospiraceae bacterium]